MSQADKPICIRHDGKPYGIQRENIDFDARKITDTLTAAGYQAYLVGGCIRDLLLGKKPKDFDIATSARPEEVAALFRNCRLIGRRFRLAHILCNTARERHIIEVATFRAPSDAPQNPDGHVAEDNHYGSLEDDVLRRDFTLNALYFDVQSGEILDFLGALDDIQNQRLKVIGVPEIRFREDPVRMLRAARFEAKLGLKLEPQATAVLAAERSNLRHIPPARLFDECQKLFLGGYGAACFERLQHHQLFAELFPDAARIFKHQNRAFAQSAYDLIAQALRDSDTRIAEERPVTLAYVLAALLWPMYQLAYLGRYQECQNWHQAMLEAIDLTHLAASERVAIPARLRIVMREIWTLQARFETIGNSERRLMSVLTHPRFRAAYDFLLLRQKAGEEFGDLPEYLLQKSMALGLNVERQARVETPYRGRRGPTQRDRRGRRRRFGG